MVRNNVNISIVIPVYNRAWCVRRAIDSAAQFIGEEPGCEIVLVDDGSNDDSFNEIASAIDAHSSNEAIDFKVSRHPRNQGVCAAKNSGSRAASGKWIVFFDSDDELAPGGCAHLKRSLACDSATAIHFFTAVGEDVAFDMTCGDTVNRIGFSEYLKAGSGGEALPVVRREVFLKYPYDEDIRGYESLAYMRIIKDHGALTLHSLGLRRYYTSHEERLSSKANTRERSRDLFVGHLRALREHFIEAPAVWSLKQFLKAGWVLVR
jgi:glycosyltransferase involved in cell wall biosynthesis